MPAYRLEGLWAKTDRSPTSEDQSLALLHHLRDSATVAGYVWDQFLSASLKHRLVKAFDGEESARALVTFLAGVHDVAKCTPAFQIQGPDHLTSACRNAGFPLDARVKINRSQLHHSLAGQIALEAWLTERHHWAKPAARRLGCVVGGHHGVFPDRGRLRDAQDLRSDPAPESLFGQGPWAHAREEVLRIIAAETGADQHLAAWSQITIPVADQVLLSAYVIVADWIASNVDLFPFEDDFSDPTARAKRGLAELDLPRPWRAAATDGSPDQLLIDRFALPETATARPIQRRALELAKQNPAPGLMVIEATTGVGKTEAALLVAEHLAARLGLGGLVFALPSMATSDAMFARAHSWLSRLPAPPDDTRAAIQLLHSKAHLNDDLSLIRRESRIASIEFDSTRGERARPIVHEWLAGRKKSILANFVVGTIDQVLFAALKSKHLVLRHLGLAGKVVILDEVHAADDYMAVFLDRALEWLGAYGVPVILLSATLPGERRAAMIRAYETGRGKVERTHRPGPVHHGETRTAPVDPYTQLGELDGYPLITMTTDGEPLAEAVDDPGRRSTIHLDTLEADESGDDLAAVTDLLDTRLADGGTAVVIRNTVGRAQQTYERLQERYGEEVSLLHSRFIATDRKHREDRLRARFGPPGPTVERPHRHIVVATQVVEQSLDVDFDLMVTDIAPVDLILQRAGRLHRHERAVRPERVREPRLCVTGFRNVEGAAPELDRGSAFVYGAHALLRALAVLDLDGPSTISLPEDVPRLVQRAYAAEFIAPDGWDEAMAGAAAEHLRKQDDRRSRAREFLLDGPSRRADLVGWTRDVSVDLAGETRGRAAVRDSQESLEVVVVQRRSDGQIYPWNAAPEESPVPTDFEPELTVARGIAADTVRLPPQLTGPWAIDRTIDDLEKNLFGGWQASRWLGGELVLVLDEQRQTTVAGCDITYDDEVGLVVTRREEPR